MSDKDRLTIHDKAYAEAQIKKMRKKYKKVSDSDRLTVRDVMKAEEAGALREAYEAAQENSMSQDRLTDADVRTARRSTEKLQGIKNFNTGSKKAISVRGSRAEVKGTKFKGVF
jgi:hypothetical protein